MPSAGLSNLEGVSHRSRWHLRTGALLGAECGRRWPAGGGRGCIGHTCGGGCGNAGRGKHPLAVRAKTRAIRSSFDWFAWRLLGDRPVQCIALIWGNETQVLRMGVDETWAVAGISLAHAQLLGPVAVLAANCSIDAGKFG